jgi:hypothetical protein
MIYPDELIWDWLEAIKTPWLHARRKRPLTCRAALVPEVRLMIDVCARRIADAEPLALLADLLEEHGAEPEHVRDLRRSVTPDVLLAWRRGTPEHGKMPRRQYQRMLRSHRANFLSFFGIFPEQTEQRANNLLCERVADTAGDDGIPF